MALTDNVVTIKPRHFLVDIWQKFTTHNNIRLIDFLLKAIARIVRWGWRSNAAKRGSIDLKKALREKQPVYQKRQHKVILLHDYAYTVKLAKERIEAFSWEILSHAAYTPYLAPFDYYLFALMGPAFAKQRFTSYENGSMTGLPQNSNSCFGVASTNC